jgi:hypothetical protein
MTAESGDHPDEHPDEHLHLLAGDGVDAQPGPPDLDLAALRAHVAGCPRCRAVVDDERTVRAALGDLPAVEVPRAFFTGLIRRRHRQALALCAGGLTGALLIWAVVAGGESGVVGDVDPEIDRLRARHLEATVESAGFAAMIDGEAMPAPYRSPRLLAGRFERIDRFHRPDGVVQVTYTDGDAVLSLFEQAGRLDPDDLPGDMEPMAVGDDGWELAGPPVRVVVVRRGDLVYTLVGDAAMATMRAAVADLPAERSLSLDRRVTAALDDLFADFGLGL